MSTVSLLLLLLSYISLLFGQKCSTEERHRRPWHLISDSERELYINGYKTLSENGKLETFVLTHADKISIQQAHSCATFLPWHRYMLWEFESAIRDLGEEYAWYV